MSETSYQWVSPLGCLSAPLTLEEVSAQIEQGRFFPPHGLSVNGEEPVAASARPELRDVWAKVLPPLTPFDGAAGRARPLILARFFAELSLSRATGYLSLRQNDARLFFTLRVVDGQILEVGAYDPSTYLGQLLVQQGRLTPQELTRALKLAHERNTPVGKVCVDEGLISIKDLNRALSEQMFVRLRRIACFPKFDLRFRSDRRARLAPPVGRVSGYAALELTLGYGLSDEEIKEYLAVLRARPVVVNAESPGVSFLSAEDRQVLKQVQHQGELTPLSERPNWTQRDGALKAIAWDMLRVFTMPRAYALLEELTQLTKSEVEGLQHLGLDEHAPFEERRAVAQRYINELGLSAPSESEEEDEVKRLVRARIDALTLPPQLSAREQAALDRLAQIGADASDEELKRSLMFEAAFQEGEACLKRSQYSAAYEAFLEASGYKPSDLGAQLKLLWASFLSSDREEGAYLSVKAQAEALIKRHSQSVEPPLMLAQIQRIYGDAERAEQNLRAILKIDPNHAQANAELRLLINREFDEKKRKRTLLRTSGEEVGFGSNLARAALAALLFVSASLWAVGSLTPTERYQWPELRSFDASALSQLSELDRRRVFYQSMRVNYDQELIMSASYRLGLKPNPRVLGNDEEGYDLTGLEGDTMRELTRSLSFLYERYEVQPSEVTDSLRLSRVIPQEMRVLGVVEGYWLSDDLFWWGRRALLLLVGLIGLAYAKPWRQDEESKPKRGEEEAWRLEGSVPVAWTLGAVVYGAVVGFLSPALTSPTPLGPLALMLTAHVLTEQLAFNAYLGGSLLKGSRGLPFTSLLAVVGAFALYKLSFFYLWQQPTEQLALAVVQMSLFIEGVSVVLMWKTRSLVPGLVAQLTLTLAPLLIH